MLTLTTKITRLSLYFFLLTAFVLPLNSYAVQLSKDGHGDVALFQYYSARSNWQTFIRIINDSSYATATKVRFREAGNGRPVLDFVVFLAPYDEWNAWTDSSAVDGSPGIRTNDTSCVTSVTQSPSQVAASFVSLSTSSNLTGAKFNTVGFTGVYDDGGTSSGISSSDRVSEGQIEVIGLAKFSPTSSNPSAVRFVDKVSNNPATGKPDNCDAAKFEFTGSLRASEVDLGQGSTFDFNNSMAANAYLINLSSGQGAGYDPRMLSDFSNTSLIAESISSDTKPDMDSATTPNIWNLHKRTGQHGTLGNAHLTGGVDSVSAALMRTHITNEWALKKSTSPGSVFKSSFSQWVVNFPTKQFYVDLQSDPDISDDISPALADHSSDNDGWAPFREQFVGNGSSCAPYIMRLINNEGGFRWHSDNTGLCYQTNVISFGSESAEKGLASKFSTVIPSSSLPLNAAQTATAKLGVARITFTENPISFTDDNGITYHGLPVDGFMIYNFEATNQQSNYTTILSHKYYRSTTN